MGKVAAIIAGLAMVSGLGAAIASYDIIRPYATKAEYREVAGRSCGNQLNWLASERRAIVRDLSQAQSAGNVNWSRTLQEQLRAVDNQINRVKKECGFS